MTKIDLERRLEDKKKELAENRDRQTAALQERERAIEAVIVIDRRHEIIVAEIATLERQLRPAYGSAPSPC